MDFSTRVTIPQSPFSITHSDKLLMIGSCFTENIGSHLKRHGFPSDINPFGIIYNPLSIFNALSRIIDGYLYNEDDVIQHNGLYISMEHHGRFSGVDEKAVLQKINERVLQSHQIFREAKYIFLTPGTSFVYEYKPNHRIVANCHKIPNTYFNKRLLQVDEIVAAYYKIKEALKDKTVLFTVSPVRHWRDGAIENSRSKAILIESIHQIISENANCHYFPAYEIVMDELRDYRFYTEDMLHPNEVAIKYIWKRFSETYFSGDTLNINKEIEKINLLLQHRVKQENTDDENAFHQKIETTIKTFRKSYPMIELDFLSGSGSSIKTGNSI